MENGKIIKIKIDKNNARTPPNLLGIDRKIAYANKKYHSGWMWIGVTIGLAGVKLSGSPKIKGSIKFNEIIAINTIITPITSLIEKYGWNGILSVFEFNPIGLFDPVICKKKIWIIVIIAIIKGIIKCNLKNRDKVALSTANPPQIQFTNIVPMYGNADNKFVITVAPQNDICPQGNT